MVVVPKDCAKTIHASGPTSAGYLSLTGVDLDGYYALVPSDQASTVPAAVLLLVTLSL